jgi:hypothetical protein
VVAEVHAVAGITPAVAVSIQSAGVPPKAGITSPLMMNLASPGSPAADHHPVFGQW